MGKALAILAVATEVLVAAGLVVLAAAGVTKAEIVTRNAAGGPNPYFFVQDFRVKRQQTLSFAEYYAKFGTTELRDGWKMENPTGEKVIYVKN